MGGAMDSTSRRPQLPALSYLDIESVKTEDDEHLRRSHYNRTAASSPPPTQHPSGPPPPYSHSANAWSDIRPERQALRLHHANDDEYDGARQLQPKRSLPSLSEALGVEGQAPYPPPAVKPAAHSSPSQTPRRSYVVDAPPLSQEYHGTPAQQSRSFRQDSAGPQAYPGSEAPQALFALSQDSRSDLRPSLHLQTPQSALSDRHERAAYTRAPSPPYEHSAGVMGPPSLPHGYAALQSKYAEQTPPSSHSSGPIFQPSSQYAASSRTLTSSWRSEPMNSRYSSDERSASSAPYGDSIKRHLDLYDLEAALNDISSSSSIVHDFSRRYGDRMHHTARSGASLSTLPGLVEIEDMIVKSRTQLDALSKIREVVLTQQVAYEQQVADQRQQVKAYRDAPPPISEAQADEEDSRGGFAGSDPKKRRGRAAPPGRCHSCNRAETPEWRRGPDGARTLCNACGLHYAKLTRKQTTASKPASLASSNLRPKEA